MSEYHGYWFFGLRNDEIVQAKNLTGEYCMLHCPQEYEGPFRTSEAAYKFRTAHPDMSKKFNQDIQEMLEFMYG